MRTLAIMVAMTLAVALSAGRAAAGAASVDYAKADSWLCLPGRQDACATNLDATAIDLNGQQTPVEFKAAADPKIDCFYVYPTVSSEPVDYADLTPGVNETRAAQSQVARFAAKCRIYAPMYRQLTLAGLRRARESGKSMDFNPPYRDVRAAWRFYLKAYNHGRGVVLIGHSQGSIHLTRLLAEEIDGKPVRKLLIAAYLAGDIGYVTPSGKDVGGTLKSIPLCRSARQFGCALVWSSYAEGDAQSPRAFGLNPGNGRVAACTNPAALAGGRASLDGFTPRPADAPESAPPWVEMKGQFTGECLADPEGTVLRIRVEPSPDAPLRTAYLERSSYPGWGLHTLDVRLVQGNLLDLVDSQSAAWMAVRR